MPDAHDDVTVIIPAYCVDEAVYEMGERLIRRLAQGHDMNIIIVENGSVSLADWDDPGGNYAHVQYLHFSNPLGYARATNIGLALADTHYLIVANVDIELPRGVDWLGTLVREYDQHGPGILSADDTGRSGVWEESWFSFWITDRPTLAKVGYLDESLPYRVHDQDYAIRMVQHGFHVLRTGSVQVVHHEASTFNKMGIDWQAEADEMIRRYGHVHFRDWRAAGGGRK